MSEGAYSIHRWNIWVREEEVFLQMLKPIIEERTR